MHLFREFIRWTYWYPFRLLVRMLPPRPLWYVEKVLALGYYLAAGAKRRLLEEELDAFYHRLEGRPDRRRIIRNAFFIFVQNEVEVLLFPALNEGNIERFMEYKGLEHLDRALEKGRGAVLLFAHFGANQMIMPAIGYKGYRMNQLSAPPDPSLWGGDVTPMKRRGAAIRQRHLESLPARHINVMGSMKEAILCLKRNEVLGVAIDGGVPSRPAVSDFLGRKVAFSTAVLHMAARNGCPVLPAFMLAVDGGRHELVIEPPLRLEGGAQAVQGALRRFVGMLEEYTLRHPCHYLWFMMVRRMVDAGAAAPRGAHA